MHHQIHMSSSFYIIKTSNNTSKLSEKTEWFILYFVTMVVYLHIIMLLDLFSHYLCFIFAYICIFKQKLSIQVGKFDLVHINKIDINEPT